MKSKEAKIFDKYENNIEHNAIVGLMVKLIAIGLASDYGKDRGLDDALYINHLLYGLRK